MQAWPQAAIAVAGVLLWLGGLKLLAVLLVTLAAAAYCATWEADRVPPGRTGVIVAPADGIVTALRALPPPAALALGEAPRWAIAIDATLRASRATLSPAEGRLGPVLRQAGGHATLPAAGDAPDNTRQLMALHTVHGTLAIARVEAPLARRITTAWSEGTMVETGTRLGALQGFGGRTLLYLPEGVRPLIGEGQTVVAGETMVAELPSGSGR